MASNVVISATSKQTATLIFLHGLGDTGHGWASAIAAIRPSYVKVICPTAPTMAVTLNKGFEMPSWFDLRSLDATAAEDEEGIKKACKTVHDLIEAEERAGIPSNRVLLGGFSQGGALALYSAFNYPKKLAGIMALSCWLPLHKKFQASEFSTVNSDIPIVQCHGDFDPLVSYKWGQMTASILKTFCSSVEFKTYKGLGHSSSGEEMTDLKKFAEKILPAV